MKRFLKSGKTALLFGLISFLFPLALLANEKVERLNKGTIDWSTRQLKVVAKASPYPDPESPAQAREGAELAAKQRPGGPI
jgi:hypothetical protein